MNFIFTKKNANNMPKMRITEQESWERLNFIGFTPSSTLLVVKVQYRRFFYSS